jgi:hypothetical protein
LVQSFIVWSDDTHGAPTDRIGCGDVFAESDPALSRPGKMPQIASITGAREFPVAVPGTLGASLVGPHHRQARRQGFLAGADSNSTGIHRGLMP